MPVAGMTRVAGELLYPFAGYVVTASYLGEGSAGVQLSDHGLYYVRRPIRIKRQLGLLVGLLVKNRRQYSPG